MAEELYIDNVKFDLTERSVAFTKQINDLGELKDRQAHYSNSIKMPKTDANVKAMDMLGVVGNQSSKPYDKLTAKYVVSGIEIVSDGRVYIGATDNYYNVKIYDGNNDIYDDLQNEKLSSLDFTSINHDLTLATYEDSLSNTSTDGYIYAIGDFHSLTDSVSIDLQTPSLYQEWVWDKIFTEAGYTYSGAIFSKTKFTDKVFTMQRGYDNAITSTSSLVYNQSKSSTLIDVTKTGLELVSTDISNFTTSVSTVYSIDVSFFFNSITWGENYRVRIKIEKGGVAKYDIVGYLSETDVADFNREYYIETGSTVTLQLQADTEYTGVPGSYKKTCVYNSTFSATDSNKTIEIDFSLLLGDTTKIDFIKDVMQRYGLVLNRDTNSNNYEFVEIDVLLADISNAEDWSDKYSHLLNTSYKIGNYSKANKASFIYDTDVDSFADGEMILANENIGIEHQLFTSIYKASQTFSTFLDTDVYKGYLWESNSDGYSYSDDGLRFFTVKYVFDTLPYKFSDMRNTVEKSISIPFLDFTNLDYQTAIDLNYSNLKETLDTQKKFTVKMNLSLLDFYLLDFMKLKFISHLGRYFYLNKVSNYIQNQLTTVELIEAKYNLTKIISGGYEDSDTYSATLTTDVVADTTPPTIPLDLIEVSSTSTTVNFRWLASTDNVAVVGYKIYKDGVYDNTATLLKGSLTGLTTVTDYDITVTATDGAGNESADSNLITIKTL